MARRSIRNSVFIAALGVAAAALVAGNAMARTIRVDQGDNYALTGQLWDPITIMGASPLSGELPFDLNVGGELLSRFCLNATEGTVHLIEDTESCASLPSDAAVLEPLAGTWLYNDSAAFFSDDGAVSYSEGRLATNDTIPPIPPSSTDAPRAVRFHWNEVGCASCSGETYSFQAILIDVGNGDFDLEFNYDFGGIPAGLGTIGFQLGTNSFQHTGAVANEQSFDSQFRNGALVDGPTAVPEPATLPLLALALSTMYALRRRLSR